MKVVDHLKEFELELLASREYGADINKRLQTIFLAKQGFTAPQIAISTGFSPRSVQEWVARYNRKGVIGLLTKSGRGRKPPLTPEETERFIQRLNAGPLPHDGVTKLHDGVAILRVKDAKRILEHEFGLVRSLSAVYHLSHQLGY